MHVAINKYGESQSYKGWGNWAKWTLAGLPGLNARLDTESRSVSISTAKIETYRNPLYFYKK